ncbi:uroporphyrinogen-III synthase [Rhizobium puerariae]|uniref:Uroporphyrinogen-III synthase n=1 Tax=Rhizobium puerariae TaxID=1585791 RepID=A0ABV6ARD1_9HYPH
MRVVVTRPEPSARRTADRLERLGHHPVLLPVSRAVHHPETARDALRKPHAALALTSAEAGRVLSSLGDQLAPYLEETLYAVGDATAKAAAAAGFRNIRTGTGTGAELAKLIASHTASLAAPLLYLAGKPRSPGFEEGLRARNLPFVTAEIYEMSPVAHDGNAIRAALLDPKADAVLLYSRKNAQLFFDLSAPHAEALAATLMLCLSDNVANAVPDEFHRNIKIAGHPDEDGLFALL